MPILVPVSQSPPRLPDEVMTIIFDIWRAWPVYGDAKKLILGWPAVRRWMPYPRGGEIHIITQQRLRAFLDALSSWKNFASNRFFRSFANLQILEIPVPHSRGFACAMASVLPNSITTLVFRIGRDADFMMCGTFANYCPRLEVLGFKYFARLSCCQMHNGWKTHTNEQIAELSPTGPWFTPAWTRMLSAFGESRSSINTLNIMSTIPCMHFDDMLRCMLDSWSTVLPGLDQVFLSTVWFRRAERRREKGPQSVSGNQIEARRENGTWEDVPETWNRWVNFRGVSLLPKEVGDIENLCSKHIRAVHFDSL
ncbi:hypothetical protein BDN72DRAFT_906848 [Pluteus cervinus]|uniref:Uncharacterized protein n=1 Tax=Pluteus cervinus TaxID=181527 RepID=A0ACD2ZYS8_9AGAR|nr:hypothetical protein BDN72DRAFT_906848 [Pluteus cervinus]